MMLKTLSALLVAVVAASPASALLLESFEGFNVGDDPSDPNNAGAPMIVDSGPGITDGTKATRITNDGGFYTQLAKVDIANAFGSQPVDSASFQVDWFLNVLNTTPGGYNGLTAAIGGATFQPLDMVSGQFQTTVDNDGNGTAFTLNYVLDAADLAGLNSALQAGSAFLELYSNKDGSNVVVDLTADNIRHEFTSVPEPASMALLGLGATALLGRRRK